MHVQRFHLTLTAGDRPVMQGWWADQATAEGKFTRWIGEHGSVDGARVVLVDEDEARVLKSWPDTDE